MTTPTDKPAFPYAGHQDELGRPTSGEGMTLREYYAGQQTITEEDNQCRELCEALAGPRPEGTWQSNPMTWAEWEAKWRAALCFLRADAMLAESQKRTIGHQ